MGLVVALRTGLRRGSDFGLFLLTVDSFAFFITFFLSNSFSKFDRPSCLARKKSRFRIFWYALLVLYIVLFTLTIDSTKQKMDKTVFSLDFSVNLMYNID